MRMSYEFQTGESVQEGIRRIAHEQLGRAIANLAPTSVHGDEAIHEARKSLKRLRALLRLARGELGEEIYRRNNECMRNAARELAGLRDAAALREALDELLQWLGSRAPRSRFKPIATWLASRHADHFEDRGMQLVELTSNVHGRLRILDAEVDDWPRHRDGWRTLSAGLRRVFLRGRREYAEVLWLPTDEALHCWRKRVKYLRYHHQLLQPIWPEIMDAAIDQADELGELLGKDHDLALLAAACTCGNGNAGHPSTLRALNRRIAERRLELQARCRVLGQRIYTERPKDFVRRLRGYWDSWSEEQIRASTDGA
jgi:CHAD domain-containing protein